jgi:hypothetical protein
VVQNTTDNGILMQPTSGAVNFVITNTTFSNSYAGISYSQSGSGAATGVIDHVAATNNGNGIFIITFAGGGSTTIAISNSIVSNNSGYGFFVNNSAALAVSIDNTEVSGNAIGIERSGTTTVTLGRSVITANSLYGVLNDTNSPFFSYKDNRINENGADISGPALTPLTLQ